MQRSERRAYGVLSSYYFVYFAALGVWIPYWPLYLEGLGLDAGAIGALMAMPLGIRILGPPMWGRLADRGARRRVVVATSFMTVAAFCLFFLAADFWLLAGATALYSLFHNGPLALVEATTMETVSRTGADYGRIRLWGSVGFILLSAALGWLLDLWTLSVVPWAMAGLLLVNALITLLLPRPEPDALPPDALPPDTLRKKGASAPAARSPGGGLFSVPGLPAFFLSGLLMQFSHGAYYGFMSIHLENHGFTGAEIGLLWALGVVGEVVVLSFSNRWLARFGVSAALTGSLILAAARWSIYAFTLWFPLLVLAQLLHAFTFGSFHVAGVRRAFEAAPPGSRATAQAWHSALSFGVGGGLGLLVSGWIFERHGAGILFALMAVAALVGTVVSIHSGRLLDRPASGGAPGREEALPEAGRG